MRVNTQQTVLLGQVTAGRMVWCPKDAMHELHNLCKQSIRRLQQSQASSCSSEVSSNTSGWRVARQRHQQLNSRPEHSQIQQSQQQQQLQLQCQQQEQPQRLLHHWQQQLTGASCSSSTFCRPLLVQQSHRTFLPAFCTPNTLWSRAAACRPFSTRSAASAGATSSSRLLGTRLICKPGSSSSSSWRGWMQQQLSGSTGSNSSRAYSQMAGKAAALPPPTASGWWDTWALWVDKTSSGLLLSSLLNSLNLVGNKLPVALGLLLVDMLHNSPLLGGSRADSLQAAYLPDHIPAGGFYSDGGAVLETASSSSSGKGGGSALRQQQQQQQSIWEVLQNLIAEANAALAAGSRLIWLGFIWLPALLTSPAVMYGGAARAWWLVLLRLSLEASGPAFIKWGQWAATRHDVFAHDVCDALEKLHTAAPAHSFRYTCKALTDSFGLPPSELFDWIEAAPMACGSIGQVHRGVLSAKGAALTGCAAGDTVAIKVRHPGVSEAIERDFETMVWLAHVAGQLIPAARSLRLDDTLKQFAAPLHEQVDLSREADNLKRFNHNFKRAKAVSFPLPLYPLVSPDVLVESFEVGRHISHYIAAKEGSNPYRVRLAELGSGTMLQMMLVDNLIHSDLHPGNILVRLEPPQGLLGLAYKTLRGLSNPEGPVMKTLGAAVDRITKQLQQQEGGGSASGSSSSENRAAVAALTVSSSGSSSSSSNGDSSSSSGGSVVQGSGMWDLSSSVRGVCAAARDPAAVLSKVQAYLSGVAANWLQPHIVLLDVGMATELSPEDQRNMVGLFRAFAALNGADVAKWTLRFSGQEQACQNPEAFVADMEATFEALKKTIAAHQAAQATWKQQQQEREKRAVERERSAAAAAAAVTQTTGSSSSDDDDSSSSTTLIPMPEQFDSGAEALSTVLELVRVHGVSLPGHICAVVVTTLILEGWSNKLAPSHSVLSQVQGMFSPAMYSWHDRMDSVVDMVMDRGDTAVSLA